ncbi:MAG: hypothetical protein AAFV80_10485 [Bacteroidota bacterium]
MHYTRLYSDEQGDTHFEEVDIELHDQGPIGMISDRYEVDQLLFRQNPKDYDFAAHNAPARQFIIMLDGFLEVITSLGERRTFHGGDILLVEDTTGKGHHSRHYKPEIRHSIFITLKG